MFQKQYHSARGDINWSEMWGNFTTIVQICAKKALAENKDFFAVQYWGECWTDTNPDKYKTAQSGKCYGLQGPGMVGSETSSAVYQIIKSNCHLFVLFRRSGNARG